MMQKQDPLHGQKGFCHFQVEIGASQNLPRGESWQCTGLFPVPLSTHTNAHTRPCPIVIFPLAENFPIPYETNHKPDPDQKGKWTVSRMNRLHGELAGGE